MFIEYATLFLLMWGCIIVFHELGHFIAMRHYKIRPRIFWETGAICVGSENQFNLLSRSQKIGVLFCGILMGLPPLLLLILVTPNFFLMCAWIGLYFIGCENDINNIYALYKNKPKKHLYIRDG